MSGAPQPHNYPDLNNFRHSTNAAKLINWCSDFFVFLINWYGFYVIRITLMV